MLLNVIIAIVVEAYLEVRKGADAITKVLITQNADTLTNDIWGGIQSYRRFMYWVSLRLVNKARFKEEAATGVRHTV